MIHRRRDLESPISIFQVIQASADLSALFHNINQYQHI